MHHIARGSNIIIDQFHRRLTTERDGARATKANLYLYNIGTSLREMTM